MVKKILLSKNGHKFYVKDCSKDFHTQFGYVKAQDLKSEGEVVTNTGKILFLFDAAFCDRYEKIKRGPQIVAKKDVGVIVTECGLGKGSRVLDAGGGSGAVCFFLANICKKVYVYELREDFYKLLEKNKGLLNASNVSIKNVDIYNGISEKKLDLIHLDLPEPWKVVAHARKALKVGGFLVAYSPSIIQIRDFVESASHTFVYIKTLEMIERKWEIDKRKIRPYTNMLGHTGFISIFRRGA